MQPQDYQATARVVRHFAGRYLSDADLDDAVQVAVMRVWQAGDLIDHDNPGAMAYLHRTTRSAVIDYLRHRGRRMREIPTPAVTCQNANMSTPENELIGREAADQIRRVFVRAWQSMSKKERERFREVLGGRRMDAARSTFDTYTARAKAKIVRAAKAEQCQDRFEKSRLTRLFAR